VSLTGKFLTPCLGAAAIVTLAGCTGSIATSQDPPGSGATPGSGGTGTGGTGSGGVGTGGAGTGVGGGVAATGGTTGGASPTGGSGGAVIGAGGATGATGGAVAATDPGRVTLHRLNRAEYDNTVRDLLGTSRAPAADFPIDDRGSGFDNLADVLTISPLHINLYYQAAETLVAELLANQTQRTRVVTCDLASGGAGCAQTSLAAFARRAWRRPVTDAETTALMGIVDVAVGQGDSVEVGLALALRAVLLSPHFIFRVELDADPTSLTPHALGPYELASRLSYFLWSTMPDDGLFTAADQSALADPARLGTEVTRMLADDKAKALVENFAGQWLYLRALETAEPAPNLFPGFDDALADAMRAESELMFREVAFGGLPLTSLLTSDFTFLNDRLATHYGLTPPGSTTPARVPLTGNLERGGLLSQGTFLTVTSHPNRTSPVKRGKWVLEELLCETVPPPDPNLDMSGAETDIAAGLSQREVLARHRADPACAGCHSLMDPIGLGLENYDAIGRYRTNDGMNAIDSAGTLPSGSSFTGPKELAALVAADPAFARCIVQKLYTYALGRTPDSTPGHLDTETVPALTTRLAAGGYSFSDLVLGIVTSPTFLNRRGDPSMGVTP
jgi:hypothetical protein